jgi:hypothetical protein
VQNCGVQGLGFRAVTFKVSIGAELVSEVVDLVRGYRDLELPFVAVALSNGLGFRVRGYRDLELPLVAVALSNGLGLRARGYLTPRVEIP